MTIKPFRFLNFWTKHKQFKDIVRQNWIANFVGSPFMELQANLKRVRKALSVWTREAYGNIFQKVATLEDVIKVKEIQFELQPSPKKRKELKREEPNLRKWLKVEEDFWQ